MTTFLIIGIIIFVIIAAVFFVITVISDKLQGFSQMLFGTSSFIDGYKRQQLELSGTPKSVSSMTAVYLPQISRDFAEFNLYEFKQKAENTLITAFNAISQANVSLLANCSDDLTVQVGNYITQLSSQNQTEIYENIHIHKTEITRYTKQNGTCVIVLQSAVEYLRYKLENGNIVFGSNEIKVQTKYNVHLVYIQDETKLQQQGIHNAIGLHCPSCGAVVTTVGSKFCEYCGGMVKEINLKSWSLNRFEEVCK